MDGFIRFKNELQKHFEEMHEKNLFKLKPMEHYEYKG